MDYSKQLSICMLKLLSVLFIHISLVQAESITLLIIIIIYLILLSLWNSTVFDSAEVPSSGIIIKGQLKTYTLANFKIFTPQLGSWHFHFLPYMPNWSLPFLLYECLCHYNKYKPIHLENVEQNIVPSPPCCDLPPPPIIKKKKNDKTKIGKQLIHRVLLM